MEIDAESSIGRRAGVTALAATLCVVLGSILPGVAATAAPGADVAFTVANYPVEAEAKNAVAAKEEALTDGQQGAFRSLLKRIVPVTAYSRLKALSDVKASSFLAGVSVRSERNSATTYIASLDFSFTADAVRQLLNREGVPFIDEQAPQLVLVPMVKGGDARLAALWRDTWRGLDLEHTLTPAKLEALKPVIHPDTIRMLEAGEPGAERILAGEYNAEHVVAAVAEVDRAQKRLVVTLSGMDAVGPLQLKRSYRLSGGELAYTMEYAAVVALGVLEGRWKAVKAGARGGVEVMSSPGVPISVQVEFQGLAQWNSIRRQLSETPGVGSLTVNTVSARAADVALTFPGGGEQLAEVLAPQGLQLRNLGGSWILRSSF